MDDFFDLPPVNIDEVEPGTRDYNTLEWCEERLKRGVKFVGAVHRL